MTSKKGLSDAIAWHLPKYLHDTATLHQNVELEADTWPGRQVFVADFVIEFGTRRIAVETSSARSLRHHVQLRRRDARLVAHGVVDAVYRIAGNDVDGRIHDALHLIAAWERVAGAGRYLPDPFAARGRVNLARLASPEARNVQLSAGQSAAQITYAASPLARRRASRRRSLTPHLLVRRFDRRFPEPWSCYEDLSPRSRSSFIQNLAA